nr:uncharacterized protein LOC110361585 isoform X2 [Columba livia]
MDVFAWDSLQKNCCSLLVLQPPVHAEERMRADYWSLEQVFLLQTLQRILDLPHCQQTSHYPLRITNGNLNENISHSFGSDLTFEESLLIKSNDSDLKEGLILIILTSRWPADSHEMSLLYCSFSTSGLLRHVV